VTASFAYDALGRRIAKTISGGTTAFHYDAADSVQESGPSGTASYLRTLGVDETLTRTDATSTLYYLTDALGSTVALTTDAGAVATVYSYEPFGETSASGSLSPNPFQFTGRENEGSGLYYYRARWYDPVRGRFLQEDPLGLAGGINLYAYVGNNPTGYTDPFGLQFTPDQPGPPTPGQLGLPPNTNIPAGTPGGPVTAPHPGAALSQMGTVLGGALAGALSQEMTRKLIEYEDNAKCGRQKVKICLVRSHPLGTVIIVPASETPLDPRYRCGPSTEVVGRGNCCPIPLPPW
jgi:RHS repeat-associated protein